MVMDFVLALNEALVDPHKAVQYLFVRVYGQRAPSLHGEAQLSLLADYTSAVQCSTPHVT